MKQQEMSVKGMVYASMFGAATAGGKRQGCGGKGGHGARVPLKIPAKLCAVLSRRGATRHPAGQHPAAPGNIACRY